MAIANTPGSATISTTEWFLASNSVTATYQTTTCQLEVDIDFTNMIAGDSYRIRSYKGINGTTRTFSDETISGVQSEPYVVLLGAVGGVSAVWEVSVIRTAGSDRSIGWNMWTTA